MDAYGDNKEFQYQTSDDLILSRQAQLLKRVLQTVGVLTAIAIGLILFLPGFVTGGDVLEPFFRNFVVILIIIAVSHVLDRGHVSAAAVAIVGVALVICPYSVYMESPGNPAMVAVMFLPIGLAGFLLRRSYFWSAYAATIALALATTWASAEFRGAEVESRSVVTLCLMLTIVALMVDGLSSSYRESVRLTFNQLEELRNANQKLIAVTADRDRAVTDRIRAETVSDRRARTEKLALEAAHAGTLLVWLSDLRVEISPEFVYRSGLDTAPTSVSELAGLMTAASAREFDDGLARLRSGEATSINGDFRLNQVDEPVIWFIAADLSRDDLTGDINLYGVIVDATDRVLAEDERRSLQEKMTETQRLESLGVLAGGIAHDFNNLLHVIMLNADIARVHAADRAQGAIDKLLLSAGRAADLCSQLLAYSGRSQAVKEQVILKGLVQEMGNLFEVSKPPNTTIVFESDGTDPVVNGDATQIRQIVMNLITNAGEAMGDSAGDIVIRVGTVDYDGTGYDFVETQHTPKPGRYGEIRVIDTGCGIPPESAFQIFEPFFTTKASGRGLGLSAVLGIVRTHEGGISVESAPGKGTEICVLLPLVPEPVRPRPTSKPVAYSGSHEGTILFADDEPEIRNLARIVLSDTGFDVIEASDGIAAARLYQEHQDDIDLVILDVMMPGNTGVEVLKIIRSTNPNQPVILSSGYSERDAMNEVTAGNVAFLKKPYLARTLREMVLQSLEEA